jgi:Indolepyruvate ferredoxin oxidoreductase, alpha and beta subunits
MPEGGLNIRWPDPPLVQEARLLDYKWYAALAYVRANKLDRVEIDSPHARFGIMTGGKAYLDVRQALTDSVSMTKPVRASASAVQGRLCMAARGARCASLRTRSRRNSGG